MESYLFIGAILVLLAIEGTILLQKKRKEGGVRLKSSAAGEGEPELVITPAYLNKLERDIQNALEGAIRSAGASMREELNTMLQEVSRENATLVSDVHDVEDTFQKNLTTEVASLQAQFTEDAQKALDELRQQNRQLVASVERIEQETKKEFQENLLGSATDVSESLTRTLEELRNEIKTMVGSAVKRELQAFHDVMIEAQKGTVQSLGRVYEEAAKQKEALEKKVVAEVAETKKQLLQRFEKSFNTVILQFLRENLGDALDLAHQEKYLVKMLEAHKEKLISQLHEEA